MVCTLIAHAGVSFEILKFLLLEGVEVDGAPENTQKSWTFFLSLSLSLVLCALMMGMGFDLDGPLLR